LDKRLVNPGAAAPSLATYKNFELLTGLKKVKVAIASSIHVWSTD
jgi:hypothetical protein